MSELTTTTNAGAIIEQVIVKGDLAKLTPTERTHYYVEVCKSAGLNPLMKPFEYITLNGKLTLYALRGCTDQLRQLRGVSVEEMTGEQRGEIYVVTCKVKNAEGRTDMSTGAVALGSLKGEALANAYMKCETKAKRRATLSLCGLGLLDETEVETIPGAKVGEPTPHDPQTGEVIQQKASSRATETKHPRYDDAATAYSKLQRSIKTAPNVAVLKQMMRDGAKDLELVKEVREASYDTLMRLAVDRETELASIVDADALQ